MRATWRAFLASKTDDDGEMRPISEYMETGINLDKGDRLYFDGMVIHCGPPTSTKLRRTMFTSMHCSSLSTNDEPVFEHTYEEASEQFPSYKKTVVPVMPQAPVFEGSDTTLHLNHEPGQERGAFEDSTSEESGPPKKAKVGQSNSIATLFQTVWHKKKRKCNIKDKSDMCFFFRAMHHYKVSNQSIVLSDVNGEVHRLGQVPLFMSHPLKCFGYDDYVCKDVIGDGSCWLYSVICLTCRGT